MATSTGFFSRFECSNSRHPLSFKLDPDSQVTGDHEVFEFFRGPSVLSRLDQNCCLVPKNEVSLKDGVTQPARPLDVGSVAWALLTA